MDKGLDIVMLRTFLACHAAVYGNPKFRLDSLIGHDGIPREDQLESAPRWLRSRGLEPDWQAADRAIDWLAAAGHHLVILGQSGYPAGLTASAVPPLLLFVDGDSDVLNAPQIAIVGSRQASPHGLDIAHDFARVLAAHELVVTSGLARGIDGAAHRGALAAGGKTLAVLGSAIDHIYPRQHRGLADEVRGSGALVSEFPFGVAPLPANFPRRNRIISGLAVGTLVVEAAIRSGSLSTALHALEQGREVFAVPGSIRSPLSKGCHALIKQGAKLVEEVSDILEELPELQLGSPAPLASPATRSTGEQGELNNPRFLHACGWESFTADDIVSRSGLTVQEVSSMLLKLELAGIIQVQGTGSYLRIR
jgi:DNA processing protein